MTWCFCPRRNMGRDLRLLLPIIREQQACRYCFPGESSSWLYPAENTKMNGAVGPEIRQDPICLRFPGGKGVWLVAGGDMRRTMLWSKASARQDWPTVGTMVLAEQKGARMKVVRNNQARAGRHEQVFSSWRQKLGPGIRQGGIRTRGQEETDGT